jgi:TorA maturation chaperone TorD
VQMPSAPTPDRAAPTRANAASAAPFPLCGEDQARADLYALVARLLLAAPDAALLAALAAADPICAGHDERPLEDAWEKLVLGAAVVDAGAAADEFTELFISTGTPPVNPYGSLYLCGYMNDKPLAALRTDLGRLRLARVPGVGELEDHLGALCETMRVLVAGGPGAPRRTLGEQKQFFESHIAPWYGACLADIASAKGANFYRLVAAFAAAFLAIEAEAFAVGEGGDE